MGEPLARGPPRPPVSHVLWSERGSRRGCVLPIRHSLAAIPAGFSPVSLFRGIPGPPSLCKAPPRRHPSLLFRLPASSSQPLISWERAGVGARGDSAVGAAPLHPPTTPPPCSPLAWCVHTHEHACTPLPGTCCAWSSGPGPSPGAARALPPPPAPAPAGRNPPTDSTDIERKQGNFQKIFHGGKRKAGGGGCMCVCDERGDLHVPPDITTC